MERGTFPNIRDDFDPFVVVRLETKSDKSSKFNTALALRLVHEDSIPIYVILDPKDESVLRDWRYKAEFTSEPKTFSRLLEEGLAVYTQRHPKPGGSEAGNGGGDDGGGRKDD